MPRSKPLVSYRTAARWTDAEARAALTALATSGMSLAGFARREGVGAHRLYEWRRRLESAEKPSFVEVQRAAPERLEVVLRSGRVLRFSQSIDTVALRRLVDALEDDSAC